GPGRGQKGVSGGQRRRTAAAGITLRTCPRLVPKTARSSGGIAKSLSGLAGRQGFEPRFHGPEPCVLPLDDLPARRGKISLAESASRSRAGCFRIASIPPKGVRC